MLFNEPKLLKLAKKCVNRFRRYRFSALQRAEIAEMTEMMIKLGLATSFSALQRAEIAEITAAARFVQAAIGFSALQRAEIAEIY